MEQEQLRVSAQDELGWHIRNAVLSCRVGVGDIAEELKGTFDRGELEILIEELRK